MRRAGAAVPLALMAALCAGCGHGPHRPPAHDPTAIPLSVGPGPRWRPASLSPAVAAARPLPGGLRCTRARRPRFGVHLELFAARRVVVVAPGMGIAPPRRRDGAYVRGGRCSYPIRTREPTGVLEVERGVRVRRLGDAFRIWGQPLGRRRLASFRGPVEAYVGGRRWRGEPRAIPLRRHAQIVLEVGGHVPPHVRYRFPAGL